MSIKRNRWFILVLFFTLFIAGCRCDNSVIPTFYGIADTPANGEVTSLTPSFNWHGSDSCEPDEYIFHIDEVGAPPSGIVNTNISPDNLPYTYVGGVGADLLPGRSYTWKLKAVNGTQGKSTWVFGPETEVGQFFTGPVCSGETLIAPELIDPGPAGWIEHEYEFAWTYTAGCLPLSYEVQFARDAAFTDIYLTATTSDPYAQHLLMAFPNCSSLFWRVRASDGTSFGPWSASRDFHYIVSDGCYQWHYMSDDYAWINVRLYEDICDQTGYIAAWTAAPLHTGCMVDGMIIVGDGTSFSSSLKDFTVDLGAGPCPSTGLDQKNGGGNVKFGVLTPGTYCVTISRDQTVDNYGPENLMDGIWTDPRSNQILVEETIDFGPGNHDYIARFVWDEIDRPFLTFPLDYTYACKLGPEKLCPTYDFAKKGDAIPILGRDKNSDWIWTELNGFPCYILLGKAFINENLANYESFEWRVEDLEIFPQPDPCPKPEPKPGPDPVSQPKSCSDYTDSTSCRLDSRCVWEDYSLRAGGVCKPK